MRVGAALVLVLVLAPGCTGGSSEEEGPDYKILDLADGSTRGETEVDDREEVTSPRELGPLEATSEVPCEPQCQGRECGEDGCGGDCGTCFGEDSTCIDGVCFCEKQCQGKECGDDDCGGVCGVCHPPMECFDGICGCEPSCEDKECGSDGCLDICGECPPPLACSNGVCECAYGTCSEGEVLDEICSGTSLGNCGLWVCVEGCCDVGQVPPPECCQTAEDCRDCINQETAETAPCPLEIPLGFVANRCTKDVCGFGNECKHFDKVVFGECNDDDECTEDSCHVETGLCSHTPILDCPPAEDPP